MIFFFEKIRSIFDIENWLWKYDFGTFWQTIIHCKIVLKQFPLSILILGQKSCILGPRIFKIPQPLLLFLYLFCQIYLHSQHVCFSSIPRSNLNFNILKIKWYFVTKVDHLYIEKHSVWSFISFSSSNNQFYESRISISPIQGVAKCFNLFNVKSCIGIFWVHCDINLKLLPGKNTQKVNKQNIRDL